MSEDPIGIFLSNFLKLLTDTENKIFGHISKQPDSNWAGPILISYVSFFWNTIKDLYVRPGQLFCLYLTHRNAGKEFTVTKILGDLIFIAYLQFDRSLKALINTPASL